MKLLMRMQETKGTMEFHQDLLRYYATNHGGLNEYIPGPPTGADGEPLENYPTDDYHRSTTRSSALRSSSSARSAPSPSSAPRLRSGWS